MSENTKDTIGEEVHNRLAKKEEDDRIKNELKDEFLNFRTTHLEKLLSFEVNPDHIEKANAFIYFQKLVAAVPFLIQDGTFKNLGEIKSGLFDALYNVNKQAKDFQDNKYKNHIFFGAIKTLQKFDLLFNSDVQKESSKILLNHFKGVKPNNELSKRLNEEVKKLDKNPDYNLSTQIKRRLIINEEAKKTAVADQGDTKPELKSK